MKARTPSAGADLRPRLYIRKVQLACQHWEWCWSTSPVGACHRGGDIVSALRGALELIDTSQGAVVIIQGSDLDQSPASS